MQMFGSTRIYGNDDLGGIDPKEAVDVMSKMYLAHHGGGFTAWRLTTGLGGADEPFSSKAALAYGGYADVGMGFRLNSFGAAEPLTVTYRPDGAIDILVLGDQFLGFRGGVIGSLGVDVLANKTPVRVAIIGSGRNGWWHVWATAGVREVTDLRVFSRDPENRERFAAKAREELGLDAKAVASAQEAVEDADIVILSTTTRSPVIDAAWVKKGAHVSSFGPKSPTEHECPTELLDRCKVIVTDIPKEERKAGPLFPEATGHAVESLGAVIAGEVSGRTDSSDITLFLLTGLGGTETVMAQLLAKSPSA